MAAGGTGTVLLTKHLLPLLRASSRPDVVNMISTCGEVGHRRSGAHPAFYAAKHAHAGLAEILSHRQPPTWMPGRLAGSGSLARMISRTTGAVSPRPSSRYRNRWTSGLPSAHSK